MNAHSVHLLQLLRRFRADDVVNPWSEVNPDDGATNGPAARRARLRAHLAIEPARVLIGEAAGYQGCRVSGIAFSSERLLLAGEIPRLSAVASRLSTRRLPWSEPSATIVWSTLHELGIAETTVLWNAFPWHPHRVRMPYSNRAPTACERAQGLTVLEALLKGFPRSRLFAVGRHAERALLEIGRRATTLRHPSMSGANEFRRALRASYRDGAEPSR